MTVFDTIEGDDWEAYKSKVKPLKGRDRIQKAEVKKIRKRDIVISEKTPIIAIKVQEQPLPAKQIKKLKKKDNIIDATIDLHGMTLARAQQMLIGFIKKCYMNELRYLEVITGKGDVERGTGKIKREVPMWLQDANIKSCILHLEVNTKNGGGSYLVVLRRHKKPG